MQIGLIRKLGQRRRSGVLLTPVDDDHADSAGRADFITRMSGPEDMCSLAR